MNKHGLSLSLLLTLITVPAAAQQYTMYDNGPLNGQAYARTINSGYAVTNSFYNSAGLILSGLSFWVWLYPGDNMYSVRISIGSTPYGTDVYDNYFNTSQSSCFINQDGYNVCLISVDFYASPSATSWLTLQDASVSNNDPVYWDQNAGVGCMSQGCPSRALQRASGMVLPTSAIPSETFTVYGIMYSENKQR